MQPVKKFIMKEDPKHIRISEFNYPLRMNVSQNSLYQCAISPNSWSTAMVKYPKTALLTSILSPDGKSDDILNNTKVIQARLHFRKETGALIEVFCLEPIEPNDYVLNFQQTEHAAWLCMIGNLKKWKEGTLNGK